MPEIPQDVYEQAVKARQAHFDNVDPDIAKKGGAIRAGQMKQLTCQCPFCRPDAYPSIATVLQIKLSGMRFCKHTPGFLTVLN